MPEFGRLDGSPYRFKAILHPEDSGKLKYLTDVIWKVGKITRQEGKYSSIDFGKEPLRFLTSEIVPVEGVLHSPRDIVLAKGDRAKILIINWNYSKKYHIIQFKRATESVQVGAENLTSKA